MISRDKPLAGFFLRFVYDGCLLQDEESAKEKMNDISALELELGELDAELRRKEENQQKKMKVLFLEALSFCCFAVYRLRALR